MKRVIGIALSILLLLFGGCTLWEQVSMENTEYLTVTVVNDVRDADIWILPATAANLNTTVWGTATAAKVSIGESRLAKAAISEETALYMFRMIDADDFYYAADSLVLEEGWTVRIFGEDLNAIAIEVTDENGVLRNTYEVFAARL